MARITKISGQVKRTDRFSIYLDGAYSFSLSELQLSTSGLKVGVELSDIDVERWKAASDEGKALDKAYMYLSYRIRSAKEIRDYLKRKKYSEEVIASIESKLREQKLVDDGGFAEGWIENRQLTAPRSKRRLEQELRQKGVPSDIITEQLAGITQDDEVATARVMVDTKRLVQRYDDERKIIAYLVGQGFSYTVAKLALEQD